MVGDMRHAEPFRVLHRLDQFFVSLVNGMTTGGNFVKQLELAEKKAQLSSLMTYDEPTSTHVYLSTLPRKNSLRFVPLSRMISRA